MATQLPHSSEIIAQYGFSQGYLHLRGILLGGVLALFAICFIAIVVEELFLGGRRRRRAENSYREQLHTRGKASNTSLPGQ